MQLIDNIEESRIITSSVLFCPLSPYNRVCSVSHLTPCVAAYSTLLIYINILLLYTYISHTLWKYCHKVGRMTEHRTQNETYYYRITI